MDFFALRKLTIVGYKKKGGGGMKLSRRKTVLIFWTLSVFLSALGCKLQPAYWIQYSNQWWRTDWNMEADRASLSEEYEMLKASGTTDACYGCLLHRYNPFILGILNRLVMLRWNELKWKEKMHSPYSSIRQTDTNYHSSFFHQLSS